MKKQQWQRYKKYYCAPKKLGLRLDISRMNFADDFFDTMAPAMAKAYDAMEALEKGAIANPDEGRQVGHYWLRNPAVAPDDERRVEVVDTIKQVKKLAGDIHTGYVRTPSGERFTHVLVVGIGGSALGPQLAQAALSTPSDTMAIHFVDNTDPDGIDLVLELLGGKLTRTLTIVISKSGGTKETRNGMLEVKTAYEDAGLEFAKYAVAVTGKGSQLDKVAKDDGWIARVPMFDYVGGRTSELSAVGLLPAALQGVDIDEFLAGAAMMDTVTRSRDTIHNPAALLALMWYYGTNGKGEKDMVVIPYKDRLLLLSKYLQQLVMESLGKELDVDGNVVNQGIAVYGNKGSTDQHAYIQQLREGLNNFFVVFVEVLKDRRGNSIEVEPQVTSGDYLEGFYLGTREALSEKDRESITVTLDAVNARSLGMIIALFERAVGLYATLININAYHQPGVEAGKKAAGLILDLQARLLEGLKANPGAQLTVDQWASKLGVVEEAEMVWKVLMHLSSNDRGIARNDEEHPDFVTFKYTG